MISYVRPTIHKALRAHQPAIDLLNTGEFRIGCAPPEDEDRANFISISTSSEPSIHISGLTEEGTITELFDRLLAVLRGGLPILKDFPNPPSEIQRIWLDEKEVLHQTNIPPEDFYKKGDDQ